MGERQVGREAGRERQRGTEGERRDGEGEGEEKRKFRKGGEGGKKVSIRIGFYYPFQLYFTTSFYYQIPTVWLYHSAGTEWQLRIIIGFADSLFATYLVYIMRLWSLL